MNIINLETGLEEKPTPPEISINPAFRDLIPTLSPEELRGLEEDILARGCRDPITLWNGVIVDGHHRYGICKRHGLSFKTRHESFEDDNDAEIWIIKNQFNRRNLSSFVRGELALELKDRLRIKAAKASSSNNRYMQAAEKESINDSPFLGCRTNETDSEKWKRYHDSNVATQIGNIANIGREQVRQIQKIKESIHQFKNQNILEELRKGERKVTPTYDELLAMERNEVAKKQFPKEKYKVIYCDLYEANPEIKYRGYFPIKDFDFIKKVPVSDYLENQAVCFLWTPLGWFKESYDLMRKWGFEFATMFFENCEGGIEGRYSYIDHNVLLVGNKHGCFPKKKYSSEFLPSRGKDAREKNTRIIIDEMYPEGNKIQFFPTEIPPEQWDVFQDQYRSLTD